MRNAILYMYIQDDDVEPVYTELMRQSEEEKGKSLSAYFHPLCSPRSHSIYTITVSFSLNLGLGGASVGESSSAGEDSSGGLSYDRPSHSQAGLETRKDQCEEDESDCTEEEGQKKVEEGRTLIATASLSSSGGASVGGVNRGSGSAGGFSRPKAPLTKT